MILFLCMKYHVGTKQDIKNETVITKSYNDSTQYKNKYVFQSMLNLYNKCHAWMIRIYGAAGHGKGLIDAMSSFGAKSILRRDIVTDEKGHSYKKQRNL